MEVDLTYKSASKFLNVELGFKTEDQILKVSDRFQRKGRVL